MEPFFRIHVLTVTSLSLFFFFANVVATARAHFLYRPARSRPHSKVLFSIYDGIIQLLCAAIGDLAVCLQIPASPASCCTFASSDAFIHRCEKLVAVSSEPFPSRRHANKVQRTTFHHSRAHSSAVRGQWQSHNPVWRGAYCDSGCLRPQV